MTGSQLYGENPANLSGTFRYTALRFDPETGGNTAQPSGLYYYRARTYSPTWGRSLQPEPLGYTAGNNLYGNDPLTLIDPFGLTKDSPQSFGGNGYPPGAPDCAINVGSTMTALIVGEASGNLIRTFGDILRQFLRDPSAPLGLGDLTVGEVNQIQSVVNQAGRPLEVVGSAARGQRTPTSDIDYVVPPSSIQHFEGLETKLPSIDPNHGIIPGTGTPNIGPGIRFEPH
jgi:RHS repeat-associated protein